MDYVGAYVGRFNDARILQTSNLIAVLNQELPVGYYLIADEGFGSQLLS